MYSPHPSATSRLPDRLAMRLSSLATFCRRAALAAALGLTGMMPMKAGAQTVIAEWDVSTMTGGVSNFGPSPLSPTTSDPNVTVEGLSRGSGVTVNGNGAMRAWGGNGWNVPTAADAIAGNKFATFVITPNPGFRASFNAIARYDYRRTGTGPDKGVIQYQVGTGDFIDIAEVDYPVSVAAGASLPPIPLDGIPALQNVSPGTPVTFRIVNYNASGTGNWYVFDVAGSPAADLSVTGSVVSVSGTPPTITSFNPDTGLPGTVVSINGTGFGASPTVSFNGTPAPGAVVNGAGTQITVPVPSGATTGSILVSTPGGSAGSGSPFTVPAQPVLTVNVESTAFPENDFRTNNTISRPVDAPAGALTVNLASSNTARATVTPASVTIAAGDINSGPFTLTGVPDNLFGPAANVTITASAAGYTSGTAVISITNVDDPPPAAPPTVVINKYLNNSPADSPDFVELLVIGNGTAGGTLDMRGMILKDFSDNMNADGGGKFTFTEEAVFAAVKVGTLIVLAFDTNSTDVDGSDFSLRLGLRDTTYFTALSGFNIATTDMVMIKARDSGTAGVNGAIHALAAGAPGLNFNDTISVKLNSASTTGTGRAILANNTNATLDDFGGTDATGGILMSPAAFGLANNAANNTYIRQLRGLTNLDGAGLATVINVTPDSPVANLNIFRRNTTGQTAAFTVLADASPGIITAVRLTVPAGFGVPSAANVSVSGPGAPSATISVTGQNITISNTAISITDSAEIVIAGLTIPNPSAVTDDGLYPFAMATAGTAGTLTPVPLSPTLRVTIPIANLRDVDANGTPLDIGKVVAIEGICTVESFNITELSGFIQDGDFGINVFNFDESMTLVRANRYIIIGPIITFRGLTEINPPNSFSIISLGAATEVPPTLVTIPQLLADPEAYEGRLVTVAGVSRSPTEADIWGVGTTITVQDEESNTLDVRIQAASTAIEEPFYPANITGIIGQFASTNPPFVGGYQIMPRDPADLVSSTVNAGYAAWAQGYPGLGGPQQDFDRDGQSNFLEFALGTIPNDATSAQQPNLAPIAGRPGFAMTKGSEAGPDLTMRYTIEGTTDLSTWIPATVNGTVFLLLDNDTVNLRAQYLGNSPRVYWRLKVVSP